MPNRVKLVYNFYSTSARRASCLSGIAITSFAVGARNTSTCELERRACPTIERIDTAHDLAQQIQHPIVVCGAANTTLSTVRLLIYLRAIT
jgi:hypothetical protein